MPSIYLTLLKEFNAFFQKKFITLQKAVREKEEHPTRRNHGVLALSSPVCVRVRGIFEIAAYRQATPKNKEAPNNVYRELPDSIYGAPLPLIADAAYGGVLVFPEHWQTGPGSVVLLLLRR